MAFDACSSPHPFHLRRLNLLNPYPPPIRGRELMPRKMYEVLSTTLNKWWWIKLIFFFFLLSFIFFFFFTFNHFFVLSLLSNYLKTFRAIFLAWLTSLDVPPGLPTEGVGWWRTPSSASQCTTVSDSWSSETVIIRRVFVGSVGSKCNPIRTVIFSWRTKTDIAIGLAIFCKQRSFGTRRTVHHTKSCLKLSFYRSIWIYRVDFEKI